MAKRNKKQEAAEAVTESLEQLSGEETAQQETQAEVQQEEVKAEAKEESRLKQDIAEALKPYKHQLQTPDGAATVRTIVRNLAQSDCNVTISKQGKVTIDFESGERIEL